MKRTAYCCRCHQTTEQYISASAPDQFVSECCKCGAKTNVPDNHRPAFNVVEFRSDSRIFFTGSED